MDKFSEVPQQTKVLQIIPVLMILPDRKKVEGLLAKDDMEQTYEVDIPGLPIWHPIDYLQSAYGSGGRIFRRMMGRACVEEAVIRIDGYERLIFPDEYSRILIRYDNICSRQEPKIVEVPMGKKADQGSVKNFSPF